MSFISNIFSLKLDNIENSNVIITFLYEIHFYFYYIKIHFIFTQERNIILSSHPHTRIVHKNPPIIVHVKTYTLYDKSPLVNCQQVMNYFEKAHI